MTDRVLTGPESVARAADDPRDAELRRLIGERLAAGAAHEAMQAARQLLETSPGRRTHRFLRDALTAAGTARTSMKPLKVALLASFSIEFLHDALVASGFASGFAIDVYQPVFATFRQEILDGASRLYAERPDAVVLAVEAEDWSLAPFDAFMDTQDGGLEPAIARVGAEIRELAAAFRSRSSAPLLLHNLALPAWRKLGILDAKAPQGQGNLLGRMNNTLSAVAREVADVHIVDYAALVNRHGALNWYDERMRLYARAPIAGPMQAHLADEYVKFLRALSGGAKKCLVLDLDNTLWGGIVGEDGVEGIRLGAGYPGSAFVQLQRYVLDLRQRGVILAIASKNNPADVEEVFARHPSMVLHTEHFAAIEIGWSVKSESLRRIAQRLSIGLEHIVFADDNPAECEEVRRALPQVHAILLPPQPERYVRALQRDGLFDTVALSDEDRRRGDLYRQRAQAEAARESVGTVEDFYRDLAMELVIAPIRTATLSRASQLTQKTSQFNVTTRRYSEAELCATLREPGWLGFTVAVRDRFGDNGIVGVVLARHAGDTLDIDLLLLSCRVIGRTVETAMLAHLCDEARARGAARLRGRVVPTAKNAPARDVFERHGFTREAARDGGVDFRLDLDTGRVDWPDWFVRT